MQIRQLFLMVLVLSALLANAQQKDCHVHTVQPGEGIYYLSRLYSTKPAHIMSVNPEIGKEMQIKVGQKLCIPKNFSVIPTEQVVEANRILQNEKLNPSKATTTSSNPAKQGDFFIHTVQKGETFYGICKLYQILAYDLIATNNLPNTILVENQKLLLPTTAILPNQAMNIKPVEVSALIEMTNAASVEAKTTLGKSTATKNKKDVAEKKSAKSDEKKKGEKPVTELKVIDEIKPASIETTTNWHTHTVQKGETYYNLTKKYGLSPNDIKTLNNLTSTDLKLGQTIVVSKPDVAIKQEEKEEGIPANALVIDISKEVAKKNAARLAESAFTQAKINNEKEPELVKQEVLKPKLEQPVVIKEEVTTEEKEIKQPEFVGEVKPEVDQADIVGEPKLTEVKQADVEIKEFPKQESTITAKPVLSFSEEYGSSYNQLSGNINYKVQKTRGVAEYTDAISGNEYLVYYNAATPGSIIKVTNLMSKQSAYVKVMGGISTADNTSNVAMKVSKKLAQQLQVLDDIFLIEVSSLAKN